MDSSDLAKVSRMRELAESGAARRRREARRISVSELAQSLGVPASQLSRWERGRNAPRPAAAITWYDALQELNG